MIIKTYFDEIFDKVEWNEKIIPRLVTIDSLLLSNSNLKIICFPVKICSIFELATQANVLMVILLVKIQYIYFIL